MNFQSNLNCDGKIVSETGPGVHILCREYIRKKAVCTFSGIFVEKNSHRNIGRSIILIVLISQPTILIYLMFMDGWMEGGMGWDWIWERKTTCGCRDAPTEGERYLTQALYIQQIMYNWRPTQALYIQQIMYSWRPTQALYIQQIMYNWRPTLALYIQQIMYDQLQWTSSNNWSNIL